MDEDRVAITSILNILEAYLPIRYLGIPLSFTFSDCLPLIDRIQQRFSGWKSKCLSYAKRVELIHSTLSSLHIFWAMVYLLPKSILRVLDHHIRDFFWNCWSSRRYIDPISWSHGGRGTYWP